MENKLGTFLVATLLLGACGGNYSNEDLDFQTAIPQSQGLEARPPAPLAVADSAELYRATRDVTVLFNGAVRNVLALLDAVRRHPPTSRAPGKRVWGPFPDDERPGWYTRVTITRGLGPTGGGQFQYAFEVSRTSASTGPWFPRLLGTFRPAAPGAGRGEGDFSIVTAESRAAGYPDDPVKPGDDFGTLDTLLATHSEVGGAIGVTMTLTNVRGERVSYAYERNQSGGGRLSFTWPGRGDFLVQEMQVTSRWLPTGAGRGDALVTAGASTGATWVECWGPDTRATYQSQSWAAGQTQGDPATCVF